MELKNNIRLRRVGILHIQNQNEPMVRIGKILAKELPQFIKKL